MSISFSVVGTIATDPRLIRPASGVPLCSFRMASDERRYDREQQTWVEGHTNWFGVVVFRSLAVHAHESFSKGDRVIVTGKLRVRNWEKDERRGTSVEIEAEAIGHDLRWGISRFEKRAGSHPEEHASMSAVNTPVSIDPAIKQFGDETEQSTTDSSATPQSAAHTVIDTETAPQRVSRLVA